MTLEILRGCHLVELCWIVCGHDGWGVTFEGARVEEILVDCDLADYDG